MFALLDSPPSSPVAPAKAATAATVTAATVTAATVTAATAAVTAATVTARVKPVMAPSRKRTVPAPPPVQAPAPDAAFKLSSSPTQFPSLNELVKTTTAGQWAAGNATAIRQPPMIESRPSAPRVQRVDKAKALRLIKVDSIASFDPPELAYACPPSTPEPAVPLPQKQAAPVHEVKVKDDWWGDE